MSLLIINMGIAVVCTIAIVTFEIVVECYR